MTAISLTLLKDGSATVKSIEGGQALTKRLSAMGITPGRTLIKEAGHSGGPVIIRVCGSRLALGRGMAAKIMVEAEQ